MRIMHFGSALVLAAGILGGPAFAAGAITGDYVEPPPRNVFVGPCHYSGEYATSGREATMAWHFSHGAPGGVDVAGLSAAAVVTADLNPAEPQGRASGVL